MLAIWSSSISGNLAHGGTADSMGRPGSGQGGGIEVETFGVLYLVGSSVTNDTAIGGAAEPGGAGGLGLGGGIFINATATLNLGSDSITGNRALGGPTPATGTSGAGYGGGVFLTFGSLPKKDSATVIAGNQASTYANDLYGSFFSSLLSLFGL